MARPVKTDSGEPLDHSVLVRMTKTQKLDTLPEYAQLAGMTESDFIRNRVFGARPRQTKATPERAALIKALGTLGHIRADLNQVLKDRHAHLFIQPERVDSVFAAIEIIANQILSDLEP